MNSKQLKLSRNELKKFNEFLKEHSSCSTDETLSMIYNVKLVFNIGNDSLVITALCSGCGSEELIGTPRKIE